MGKPISLLDLATAGEQGLIIRIHTRLLTEDTLHVGLAAILAVQLPREHVYFRERNTRGRYRLH